MILNKKIKTAFAFVFGLLLLSSPAMNSHDHVARTTSSCETMAYNHNKHEKVVNMLDNGTITLEYYLLNIYRNEFEVDSTSSMFDSNCKLTFDYNYLTDTFSNALLSFSYFDETYPYGIEHSVSVPTLDFVNHNFNCRLLINSGELNFYVENDDQFLWIPVLDDLTQFIDGYFEFYGSLTFNTILNETNAIETIIRTYGYSDGYDYGYQIGLDTGYEQGFTQGQEAVNQQMYQSGYTKGYDDATERYADGSLSLNGVLTAIITAPATIIKEGLDFEILGFNVGSLVMSLIVIGLVVWAIGFFKKG